MNFLKRLDKSPKVSYDINWRGVSCPQRSMDLCGHFLYHEKPQFYWGFKKALAMGRKIRPPVL